MSKNHILAALLAFLASSACVSAQTSSDLGTWCSIQAVKSWGQPYAMARLEHRSCNNISSTECWFLMAGAGYNLTKSLKGDLSYEFWKIPVSGNATVHKAVASLTGTLRREGLSASLREKYELAFNAAGGAPSSTLRSRLRVQYTPDRGVLRPYIMYEYFNGFSGTGWIRSLHYFGADINLGAHSGIDVFYMYHLYPQGSDLLSANLIGIGYNLTF